MRAENTECRFAQIEGERDYYKRAAERRENQRDMLREALQYAVDNSEFNSEHFDGIARAALKECE